MLKEEDAVWAVPIKNTLPDVEQDAIHAANNVKIQAIHDACAVKIKAIDATLK
jgi:hypothetical protein